MHKRYVVAMLAVSIVAVGGLSVKNVSAVGGMVISQVQAGASTSEIPLDAQPAATKEFISLYNNSGQDIDITDWCLKNKSDLSFGCFASGDINTTLHLSSHNYATITSDSFAHQHAYLPDIMYITLNKTSGNITASGDTISIIDVDGSVVDSIGWTAGLSGGLLLQRKADAGTPDQLIDTGDIGDFIKLASLVVPPSRLEEWVSIPDVCNNIDDSQLVIPAGYYGDGHGACYSIPDACSNIDGLQEVVPEGYGLDENNLCKVDVCRNISGLQLTMPPGKELDSVGNCVDHDECSNLPYIQSAIPDGFMRAEDNSCILGLLPLRLTELLPNAYGDDIGHEYIEIYNPNDSRVDLLYYFFYVGSDNTHFYSFPAGTYIEPMQYRAFYNDDINFTLVNTTGSVRLRAIDNSFIDDTPVYDNAGSGMAWALINNTWQYTNQPTPGATNLASIVDDVEEVVTGLRPCASNQYRNLETNRCRLLVTITSTLAPCKDGQYRSEETNRCRSIASDASVLMPCGAGEERNPETNRCRSVLGSSSTLVPCGEGQERNPETNHCRNIVSTIPEAGFAVDPITDAAGGMVGWWAFGGVGLLALGYAGWEWRVEARRLFRKIGSFFHSVK